MRSHKSWGRMSKSHPVRTATSTQQTVAHSGFEPRVSDSWFPVLPLHLLFPLPAMLFPQIPAWLPPSLPVGLSANVTSPAHLVSSTGPPPPCFTFQVRLSPAGIVLSTCRPLTLLLDCQLHEGQARLSAAVTPAVALRRHRAGRRPSEPLRNGWTRVREAPRWDLDLFYGEGRRETEGKRHCGLCPFHNPAVAAAPLIRPQLTEKPFSHQLPLLTQILAVKSGQWPSS